jgi:hypothetical protein
MEGFDADIAPASPRPKTVTVLGLLVGIAAVFSYLGAYAFANALVSAEMLPAWSSGSDPRPRWFAVTFCILLGSFMLIGMIARFISGRQLRTIDDMENAESSDSIDNPIPPPPPPPSNQQ